jgi:predicted DsbA family dithiol-disulfide isomerase
LFRAYFEQGRDIGSESDLIDIARECGLPAAVVEDYQRGFAAEAASAAAGGVALVLAEEQRLRALGVQNVPNLLINGHVLVPGPAEEAIYVQALDQVLFPQPAEAQPPRWLH